MHTVILGPMSKFKDGRTKKKEFHFDIVTTASEHHFRVCWCVCVHVRVRG